MRLAQRLRYHKARRAYRDTSWDAWQAFQAHLGAVDARIVRFIRADGPLTADAIEIRTGLRHQTVSAQIRHLVDAGILCDSGIRGRTQTGRSAIAWALVPPDDATAMEVAS